jgi:hypothetical protein
VLDDEPGFGGALGKSGDEGCRLVGGGTVPRQVHRRIDGGGAEARGVEEVDHRPVFG